MKRLGGLIFGRLLRCRITRKKETNYNSQNTKQAWIGYHENSGRVESASLSAEFCGGEEWTSLVVVGFRIRKLFAIDDHSPLAHGTNATVPSKPRVNTLAVIRCRRIRRIVVVLVTLCTSIVK